ncbi:MAG: amidohydrolase [Actinobacteria bacterium]|nr:MAG: amidohydrolase [Actinomycetota bacterium]
MLNGTRVIDADGHLNDWHLDWERLLPPDLGPGATRSVRDRQGFPHLQVDGMLLPGSERDDLDYHDLEAVMKQMTRDGRYWLPLRPGEEDPVQRLPDMDEMGIDVAVLFGGHCLLVASVVESPDIAAATLRVYNDYLAGYCATAPDRLKGVAMIPMQSPKVAADELRRAVNELGFVAGVLPPHHKNGTMLADPSLEPIWDAAEELNVPICIHTIGIQISPAAPLAPGQIMGETYGGFPSMLALGSVVLGGVLERHPNLRVAFLEAGAGWVPYVMDRLQESYETFSLHAEKLPRDPEDYIRGGQVYIATEPEERALPLVAELLGEDYLVLGSDYCHPEGMCPFTMTALAERADLSDDLKRKILYDNPTRLYGLS